MSSEMSKLVSNDLLNCNHFEYIKEHTVESYVDSLIKTRKQNSYFFVCTIDGDGANWFQKSFHKSQRNEAVEYIRKSINKRVFITTNLFETRERLEKNISQIRKITIDLDIYNSKFKDKTAQEVAVIIEEEEFKKNNIPFANEIGFSGGGIYLTWDLKFTPAGKVLAKRRVIAKILFEMLKQYGPDAKSLDAAHVFSVPETINHKYENKPFVRIYKNSIDQYTLAALSRSLPSLWDVWKKEKKINITKDKATSKKKLASIIPLHKERTLAHDHIVTIKQLIQLRHGDLEGYRECLLFFVRNAYHKMHMKRFYESDKTLYEESLKLALEVNEMFSKKLSMSEVMKNTLNVKKLYNFKTETIIDWFDITLDEQINLKVKTYEAKKEKNKRHARIVKNIKEEDTHDFKKQKIEQYFAENPTASLRKASKELDIHRDTVKKYRP